MVKNLKLKLFMAHKNLLTMIEINPIKICQALGGITASFILYKAVRIYLIKRKYNHIPGPPTKGFDLFIIFI
jgi:hypothetical protein